LFLILAVLVAAIVLIVLALALVGRHPRRARTSSSGVERQIAASPPDDKAEDHHVSPSERAREAIHYVEDYVLHHIMEDSDE
jgi:Tfp pilus assembly protein PilV